MLVAQAWFSLGFLDLFMAHGNSTKWSSGYPNCVVETWPASGGVTSGHCQVVIAGSAEGYCWVRFSTMPAPW